MYPVVVISVLQVACSRKKVIWAILTPTGTSYALLSVKQQSSCIISVLGEHKQ